MATNVFLHWLCYILVIKYVSQVSYDAVPKFIQGFLFIGAVVGNGMLYTIYWYISIFPAIDNGRNGILRIIL